MRKHFLFPLVIIGFLGLSSFENLYCNVSFTVTNSQTEKFIIHYVGSQFSCCNPVPPGAAAVDKYKVHSLFGFFSWDEYLYSYTIPASDGASFHEQYRGCFYLV